MPLAQQTLTIPEFCLLLLVAPKSAKSSAFAERHFAPEDILAVDPGREGGAKLAAVEDELRRRLTDRRFTVLDATLLDAKLRAPLIALAKACHAEMAAILFAPEKEACFAELGEYTEKEKKAVLRELQLVESSRQSLPTKEGVKHVDYLGGIEAINGLREVIRAPLPTDRRGDEGPFDIIGDVHGCANELENLLRHLGYEVQVEGAAGQRRYAVTPPSGRRALFLGDLADRGPFSPDVFRLVMGMAAKGTALCIMGNHEYRLARKLAGKNVSLTHGLGETMAQFAQQPDDFSAEVATFLGTLDHHYLLDRGRLCVAHAGLIPSLQNRLSNRVEKFALFGETTGETDSYGLPVRLDWASGYDGEAHVVYGHTPMLDAEWVGRTICIDTGCVFGGRLTALRWPERELVSVPAEKVWSEPKKPLEAVSK